MLQGSKHLKTQKIETWNLSLPKNRCSYFTPSMPVGYLLRLLTFSVSEKFEQSETIEQPHQITWNDMSFSFFFFFANLFARTYLKFQNWKLTQKGTRRSAFLSLCVNSFRNPNGRFEHERSAMRKNHNHAILFPRVILFVRVQVHKLCQTLLLLHFCNKTNRSGQQTEYDHK